MEFRKKIWEIYPHERSTTLPWGFNLEPKFDVEQYKNLQFVGACHYVRGLEGASDEI
jgi:hypothetical protein